MIQGDLLTFHALMNCVMQLDPDRTPPTEPKQVKLVKTTGTLKWQASTDNKRVLGYNIYSNGKRIGFTPLNHLWWIKA